MMDKAIKALVKDISKVHAVDALLLSDSFTSDSDDQSSDFDLYVYLNQTWAAEERKKKLEPHCSILNVETASLENADYGRLLEGQDLHLVYRNLNWIADELDRILIEGQAATGYSTSIWANFKDSRILFDRRGMAAALQEHVSIEYPESLRRNIIARNHSLLKQGGTAYYHQIKKALAGRDRISVNHLISAFLASYFDILFAFNRVPHPGDKGLVENCQKLCNVLPENFTALLDQLMDFQAANQGNELLFCLIEIVENLDDLLDTADR